jgi:hypothetical protein
LTVNPEYGNGSVSVNKLSDKSGNGLSLLTCFFKKVDGKIMISVNIFKDGSTTPLIPIPKVDYCRLRGGLSESPIIKVVLDEISKFGNVTQPCPLEPGFLYLKDLYLDDTPHAMLLAVFPSGDYRVEVRLLNENKSKLVEYIKLIVLANYSKNG